MARPEGFEPPTTKFVAWYSIQLSYGRAQKRNCDLRMAVSQSLDAAQESCSDPPVCTGVGAFATAITNRTD